MKYKNTDNILIANAASPLNVGDLVILQSMLTILRKEYSLKNIKIHSFDPSLLSRKIKISCNSSISYFLGFENTKTIVRIQRFLCFFLTFTKLKLFNTVPLHSRNPIDAIISDYLHADVIMFTGGGYLRSQKGLLQSLSLLLEIIPFRISMVLNKKIIVYPISFGPFAYKWQERYAAHLLKNAHTVMLREKISYDTLLSYNLKNIVLTSDLALLTRPNFVGSTKSKEVGFTVRSWLSKPKQQEFNKAMATSLLQFSKKHTVKLRPIVQVSASKYNDNDAIETNTICRILRDGDVSVLPPIIASDAQAPAKIYKNLSFLVGMRLHSTLIAATQGVVSCAIAYEHKTDGIFSDLGMKKLVLKAEETYADNLYPLLENAYKNRIETRKNMIRSLNKIRTVETKKILGIM